MIRKWDEFSCSFRQEVLYLLRHTLTDSQPQVFLDHRPVQQAVENIMISLQTKDVRQLNLSSVSVFKNPNRTEKVKPEISVSVAFLETELVSYK